MAFPHGPLRQTNSEGARAPSPLAQGRLPTFLVSLSSSLPSPNLGGGGGGGGGSESP